MRGPWIALLLVLTGCAGGGGHAGGGGPSGSGRADGATTAVTAAAPSGSASGLEQIVDDPRSRLLGAYVERARGGLHVMTWWGCVDTGCPRTRVIVDRQPDGEITYRRWTAHRWAPYTTPERQPASPFTQLLSTYVTSLFPGEPGRPAVVAGGDGATLLPFQAAAYSVDGAHWTRYTIPETEGQRAYVSGQVELSDGRLLVLLDHWSGDRRGRPSRPHHGLWVSDGEDWSGYRPITPVFRPGLPPAPGGWSALVSLEARPDTSLAGGVLWARTIDDELYVSTDGAMSFRRVPTR